jgi:hypothetical protein
MKVGKKKSESFYIIGYLLELYHKKLVIWKLVFRKSGEFGPLFSMENPLFGSKSYFSGRKI